MKILWVTLIMFLYSCGGQQQEIDVNSPGSLNQSIPVESNPSEQETNPNPVIKIDNSLCCPHGLAGEEIQVNIEFSPPPMASTVKEMRIFAVYGAGACATEDDIPIARWEPYSSEKSYPITLMVNEVSYYVTVQFMDESGNISDIYCSDSLIEAELDTSPW